MSNTKILNVNQSSFFTRSPYCLRIVFVLLSFYTLCINFNIASAVNKNQHSNTEFDINLSEDKKSLHVSLKINHSFDKDLILTIPNDSSVNQKMFSNIKVINSKHQLTVVQNADKPHVIVKIPQKYIGNIKISYDVEKLDKSIWNGAKTELKNNSFAVDGFNVLLLPQNMDVNNRSLSLNYNDGLNTKSYSSSFYSSGNNKQFLKEQYSNLFKEFGKVHFGNSSSFLKDFDSVLQKYNNLFGTLDKNITDEFFNENYSPKYYAFLCHRHLHNWVRDKQQNSANKDAMLYGMGLTDYYQLLIQHKYQNITLDDLVNHTNKYLRAYYTSFANTDNKFTDKTKYYHGFLLGMYVNNMIIEHNPKYSINDVVHDLLRVAYKESFKTETFINIVKNYVSKDQLNQILEFINKNKTITFNNKTLPLRKIMIGKYDLGFDYDYLKKNSTVHGIDKDSNAYKAGLRNGDRVISYNIQKNIRKVSTVITPTHEYNFIPEHHKKINIFQINNVSQDDQNKINKFYGFDKQDSLSKN